MNTLTIVPLSTPGNISRKAEDIIRSADTLFLQTSAHQSAKWILDAGLSFETMDDLYGECFDFDELNQAIANRLMCGKSVVYAVPGRGIGQAQFEAILSAAKENDVEVIRLPGTGYGDTALACIPDAVFDGVTICPANQLPLRIDPYTPLCIEELDTRLRAGEVKLALSEYYPDEYPVWFCPMDESGNYNPVSIPLYELDRQENYFAATCCILKAAEPGTLPRGDVDDLMRIMRVLRAPGGCPWDAEQTHASIRSALIEESYEVIDAIDRDDTEALLEELGDLLLQVVFHTIMEEEMSSFNLRDVATGIINKLVYRHPHVFGSTSVNDSDEVLVNWEQLKKKEKHQATCADTMHAVPKGFPALMRSAKIQKKAANVGFDWASAEEALFKLPEEVEELKEAMQSGDAAHIDEEIGDVFFAAVNVCRLLKRDPEAMLNASTDKFMNRFERTEQLILADRGTLEGMSLEEMDEYWVKAKAEMQKK